MTTSIFSAIICASEACFRFPIRCPVSEPERLKSDCGGKSRLNFPLFTLPRSPVKIRRGMGEMVVSL